MHEKGKKRAKRIFGLLSAKNVFRKLLILKRNLVGASGFEPPTSWSRTRRSSQAEPRPAILSVYGITLSGQVLRGCLPSIRDRRRTTAGAAPGARGRGATLRRRSAFPRPLLVAEVRRAVDQVRAEIRSGDLNGPPVEERVERALEALARPSLRRVINATGVVLHTNLGRAPLGSLSAFSGLLQPGV